MVVRLFALLALAAISAHLAVAQEETPPDPGNEEQFLSDVRQLTFDGRRAGEGYFSADGTRLVFQSERAPENPFYQIYLLDLTTGDTDRISPGHGKTTCAWIHPDGEKVLFASTHDDPETLRKQQAELDFRASGQERRYSWDYDPAYDLYETPIGGDTYTNLTSTVGYDAEGSWSPDGSLVAFASNRDAYNRHLTDGEKETLDRDPAYFMDIFLMNADGSNVRRLTDAPGYDGGPFFSPDGQRIIWRRFSEDGATAEVYTMNVDGTDQTPITQLGAMSWAPFYHPSGKYAIFTTNLQGFGNFELYIVDIQGAKEPVRVTFTDGFDGLPVFSPDGSKLCWTTNRTSTGNSQLFLADWNHEAALEAIGSAAQAAEHDPQVVAPRGDAAIRAKDMEEVVAQLASDEYGGRMTGSEGEHKATDLVANAFEQLDLAPAGDDGSYFQSFEFTAGVSLGTENVLSLKLADADQAYNFEVDADWRPLAFSQTGPIEPTPVVFAGYGIVAPTEGSIGEYDSYVHLDVQDKWVMVLRYVPNDISVEKRAHFNRFASLRYKAMAARDRGAKGLIVVTGPNTETNSDLVRLAFDASLSGAGIAAVSISDETAQLLFSNMDKSLSDVEEELSTGEPAMGFELDGVALSGTIDIQHEKAQGRNVIARLQAGAEPAGNAVLVGAHIDHLGKGGGGASSLARPNEVGMIHYGADDNASGVAGLIEIAAHLADRHDRNELDMKQDLLFAAWSGEELGLLGSNHYVTSLAEDLGVESLSPAISAYLNMDMIGRLRDNLIVGGVGTSSVWPGQIERANVPVGLALTLQQDAYLPTDATSLFMKGVPFLSAYTGAHEDYHTPRDTADKINYEGAAQIAHFFAIIARSLVTSGEIPDYIAQTAPEDQGRRASLRAYLGTIPDYAQTDVKGVKLGGVSKGGPAETAGIRGGDVVVQVGDKAIENIYDYTYAIEALKVGEPVDIVVDRDGESITFNVTPGSRD